MLARFPSRPEQPPEPDPPPFEVIYIGDAKDLNTRPIAGHNRVERYVELFEDSALEQLYVTLSELYDTDCDDYAVQRMLSFHVEAMLVWRYARAHDHPPVLHYKDTPKARDWVDRVVAKHKARAARLASHD